MGLPVEGDGWWRIDIGEEGVPHGVVGLRDATCVKLGKDCNPVPPITAIETGSGGTFLLVDREWLKGHVTFTIVVVRDVGHFAKSYV